MNQLLRNTLLLAAGLFLSSAAAHAAVYHVSIDTSTLTATGNGPFSLDFQFNGGDTPGNNTALISNFDFGGGSATGSANLTGSVTGSLLTSVSFTNTSAFSEFYQTFTAGGVLQFDVTLTQNLDGITPDSFSVAILDGNLNNIDTNSAFGSLVQIDINTTGTLNVNTASGTGVYSGVTTTVPEPSSTMLVGLLAGGMLLRRRRRN